MFFVQATEKLQSSALSANLHGVDGVNSHKAKSRVFSGSLVLLICIEAVMRLSQFYRILKRNSSCRNRQVHIKKKKSRMHEFGHCFLMLDVECYPSFVG